MDNRLHKRVILEKREKIEVNPTTSSFYCLLSFQFLKQEDGNQTEPADLLGSRKLVEYSGRTKELEFTRAEDWRRRAGA